MNTNENGHNGVLDEETIKLIESHLKTESVIEHPSIKEPYESKINELNYQLNYYKENITCLQKKQNESISKIRSLEKDSMNMRKQLEIIANTKPYRIAYFIRRFSHEFLKGDINDKKDFLKWIYNKLIKKESGLEFRYNPIMALIKK